jgi:hypothetical protein
MSTLEQEVHEGHFRVAVFGSARTEPNDAAYNLVHTLAGMIAGAGMDLVTGGGPGLMDAASRGYNQAKQNGRQHSIGLNIWLPMEQTDAAHLDIKAEFDHFSERLDHFIVLSNAFVVAPGGIGTVLELFYTWQLAQVRHIQSKPIILLGELWSDLLTWIGDALLKDGYIDPQDLDLVYSVSSCSEAFEIITKSYEAYIRGDREFCQNYHQYKLKNTV